MVKPLFATGMNSKCLQQAKYYYYRSIDAHTYSRNTDIYKWRIALKLPRFRYQINVDHNLL